MATCLSRHLTFYLVLCRFSCQGRCTHNVLPIYYCCSCPSRKNKIVAISFSSCERNIKQVYHLTGTWHEFTHKWKSASAHPRARSGKIYEQQRMLGWSNIRKRDREGIYSSVSFQRAASSKVGTISKRDRSMRTNKNKVAAHMDFN
jgi:hypothetical protein